MNSSGQGLPIVVLQRPPPIVELPPDAVLQRPPPIVVKQLEAILQQPPPTKASAVSGAVSVASQSAL